MAIVSNNIRPTILNAITLGRNSPIKSIRLWTFRNIMKIEHIVYLQLTHCYGCANGLHKQENEGQQAWKNTSTPSVLVT
jgi:hypothetical protein